MANCPLTLRITKGSKLTFAELDGNFISLANCINNLPQYDSFVTGGTYNTLTSSIDFSGNFDFIPFSTDLSYLANIDITVTGGTYDSSTGVVTFYNNSGGTFQVSGFLTGYTNYYTTGVTLNGTTLEFGRTDLSNAYSVDLSSLMFTGNTSGDCITDLYISNLYGCSPITLHDNLVIESGLTITSLNGGGQIELDYALQPSNILISTDNGGGTESFINLQQTELNLSSLNGDVRVQSSSSNDFRSGGLFSNKSQILMEPDFVKIGVVDPSAVFSNDYESVVVYNTLSSDQSTSNANKWPVIVSSKNSTVLSGVRNSVILGGQGITASTNDTVYVNNLNINTVGGGTSIINLGLDVNGNVVTGNTESNAFTGGTVLGETIFSSGLSANTISATTYYNLPIDVYTTGMTFNNSNYNLTISKNDGTSYTQSLAILATDMTVTGGTYNANTGVATFTNNSGGTFTVSGFLTGQTDTFVTGLTFNNNTLTVKQTNNQADVNVLINTLTGLTINGGLTANTISATTIGSPINCVSDLYTSNIHSCSPLNINPLDEGNVYFGSTSAVTIDLSNNRVGIGTNTPQYPLQILGSNSTFYYDPNSVGGRFNVSGSTNIPRYDISIASYLTKPATGGSVGMRTWNDLSWSAYGKVGDMFMYAGNATNGLNIINGPGTGTEDYIRFYVGQTATGSADLHIQGSGSTRGYVGIGTESPTQKLHVNGNTLVNGSLSADTILVSGITVNPKQTIALFFGFDSVNPLDSTTYYIGNQINLAPVTSGQDGRRVLSPKTGVIKRVDITQSVGGTLGTSETSTFTINNVTQSTQSTVSTSITYDSSSSINAYNLSSPLNVNDGDKIEIRWTTPAWVTNPTAVRSQMNVYLEY